MRTVNFEKITVADSVKTLTESKYLPSALGVGSGDVVVSPAVLITVEGGDIRYRLDGNDPTATDGHLLSNGDVLKLQDYQDIQRFKAIRVGSVSGVLQVSYFDKADL